MADVGVIDNFVDTQNSTLTNVSDSLTYLQLFNLTVDTDSNVTKHQLTNNTIDNVFSLSLNSIQGTMKVTTPELPALVELTKEVNGIRPIKLWKLTFTDYSNNIILTTFEAQMKTLNIVDSGIGAIDVSFRLEATELFVGT